MDEKILYFSVEWVDVTFPVFDVWIFIDTHETKWKGTRKCSALLLFDVVYEFIIMLTFKTGTF